MFVLVALAVMISSKGTSMDSYAKEFSKRIGRPPSEEDLKRILGLLPVLPGDKARNFDQTLSEIGGDHDDVIAAINTISSEEQMAKNESATKKKSHRKFALYCMAAGALLGTATACCLAFRDAAVKVAIGHYNQAEANYKVAKEKADMEFKTAEQILEARAKTQDTLMVSEILESMNNKQEEWGYTFGGSLFNKRTKVVIGLDGSRVFIASPFYMKLSNDQQASIRRAAAKLPR